MGGVGAQLELNLAVTEVTYRRDGKTEFARLP